MPDEMPDKSLLHNMVAMLMSIGRKNKIFCKLNGKFAEI
jgi:hypothetical protein